ncbi:MAG: choice-of-anchor J domain-containing protein [Bacteroidales bacterium]
MYFIGSIFFGESDVAWLGTVNLTTGKLDTLGETPYMVGLACNSKGELYGLGNQKLYAINKTNAIVREIGTIDANMTTYSQSLDFDRDNDELYWTGNCNKKGDGGFFAKINTTTAKVTKIGRFANDAQLMCLYIPFSPVESGAPAAVTEASIQAADKGALSVSISFKVPTLTHGGTALGAITTLDILRNDTLLKSYPSPLKGSALSYTDNLANKGMYAYTIVAKNAVGLGEKVSQTLFVGEDVAGAPSNLVVVKTEQGSTLTWVAPTKGLNTGWFNAEQLKYKITRFPDKVELSANIVGTSYNDHSVPQLGDYSYTVQAYTNIGNGGLATSAPLLLGDAYKTPYSCTFDQKEDLLMWTILDENKDKTIWKHYYEGMAKYSYNSTNDANDWLISSPIAMQMGKTYKLKFDFKTEYGEDIEKLNVFYGKGATAIAQKDTLLDLNAYANDQFVTQSVRISPKETGNYNIGFHAYTPKSGYGMYIDNVKVEEMFENDLAAIAISGTSLPTQGKENAYYVTLENTGISTQSAYRIELVNEDKVLCSQELLTPFASGEIKEFRIVWNPTKTEAISIKARVVLAGDLNANNNATDSLAVEVQAPSEQQWATIGVVNDENYSSVPISFGYNNSASQTIYLAKEIGFYGRIDTLTYTYQCGSDTIVKPIKVYMSTTKFPNLSYDITSSEYGFLPLSGMTLVYEGPLSLTAKANNTKVNIPLSKPFVYTNDNLCITIVKDDSVYFNSTYFMITKTAEERTQYYESDESPYTETSYSSAKKAFPNIIISANTTGAKMQGTIKCQGLPVAAATLTLNPGNISVNTDSEGAYVFAYIPMGTYTLSVNKHEYEEYIMENIVFGKEESKSLNLEIRELAKYGITGIVKNPEGQALANAIVNIRGYANFADTTDATGAFVIEKVYKAKQYSIEVNHKEFYTYRNQFDMGDTALVFSVLMADIPYAPAKVVAALSDTKVDINWGDPANKEYRYDDGVAVGALGFNSPFAPVDHYVIGSAHPVPSVLNGMSWYTMAGEAPHDSIYIFVLDLDSDGNPAPTHILFTQKVINTDDQWSSFDFPNAIECPRGFMIAVSHTGFVGIAHDAGTSFEWPYMPKRNYTADIKKGSYVESVKPQTFNFMVRAKGYEMVKQEVDTLTMATAACPSNSATTALNTNVHFPDLVNVSCEPYTIEEARICNASKSVQGYKVWRLLEENKTNAATWQLLSESVPTTKTYVDNTWAKAADGAYVYAVKAIYKGISSAASFSNMIPKNMSAQITVNVTTNTTPNFSDGAMVTLRNIDQKGNHVYTAKVSNGKALFTEVWKGTYTLQIILTEYGPIMDSNLDLRSDKALTYELKEVQVNPYNLSVTKAKDKEYIFNWNVNPAIVDDFEKHKDFEINSPGTLGWNHIDADGGETYGIGGFEDAIPNTNAPMAYRILNPSATKPSMLDDPEAKALAPHSGKKLLTFWSPIDMDNEDYFISPELLFAHDFTFSFWARAYDRPERMKVGYSVSGKAQSDFSYWVTPGKYVTVPVGNWVQYTYTLPYTAKYVTIECVSHLGFVLMVDDVFIGETETTPAAKKIAKYEVYLDGTKLGDASKHSFTFTDVKDGVHTAGVKALYKSGETKLVTTEFTAKATGVELEEETSKLRFYPNPVEGVLNIDGEYTSLKIYNMMGNLVETVNEGSRVDMTNFRPGVYFIKAYFKTQAKIYKVVVK